MEVVDRKTALIPSLKKWKPRLRGDVVDQMIEELAKTKGKASLSAQKRSTLRRLLNEGSPPPRRFLADLGVTRHDFPDPENWIYDLFVGEPKKYLALLKQRIKMMDLGALAGPISLDEEIEGRLPMPMPETVIQEGPDKYRCIMDFSRVPDGDYEEFEEGQGPPTANKGYHKQEKGCSFPGIPDKEALMMANPKGFISTNDLSGMFWQCKQHATVLHMQIVILWIPGWREPLYLVLMTNAMGTAGAPASCVALHVGLVELADKLSPGILSTTDYTMPTAYGLKVDKDLKWTDFLAKDPVRRVNPRKWVYLQGAAYGKWKTGTKLEQFLVHIDDVNVYGPDFDTCLMRCTYLRNFYRKIRFKISPKIDETPVQLQTVTGHDADLGADPMTIGYSDKKWESFRESIVPLLESEDETMFTFESLLKAGGHLLHISEVFFYLKPICIPFSRWLGKLNHICKQDKRKWREIMKKKSRVPRSLKELLSKAWDSACSEVSLSVGWRMSSEIDAHRILSTDACSQSDHTSIPDWMVKSKWHPAGFGAVEHGTGTRTMFYLPKDHPLALRTIQFQELFMAVGWVINRAKPGETVVIYVDNTCAEWWLRGYKAKDLYIALIWILADFIRDNRIHLIVRRSDSSHIAADPLSRWFDYDKEDLKSAEDDWEVRAGDWQIPPEGPTVDFDWEGLFGEVLELESL